MAAFIGASQASVEKNRANVDRLGFSKDSAIGRASSQACFAPDLTSADVNGMTD
jgi:hypothetical protein